MKSRLHKSPIPNRDIGSHHRRREVRKRWRKRRLHSTRAARDAWRACTKLQYADALALTILRPRHSLRVKRRGGRGTGGCVAAFTNTMLQSLAPGGVMLEGARFLPQVLTPLIGAAERSEPLEPVVSAIVRMFGFDTFV